MRYLLFFLTTLLASCSTTLDVTEHEYIPSFLGDGVTTKKLFLCFDERNPKFGSRLVLSHGFDKCQVHEHIASLPINTKIKLSRVVKYRKGIILTSERWHVLGKAGDLNFYHDLDWIVGQNDVFLRKGNEVPWEILHITND